MSAAPKAMRANRKGAMLSIAAVISPGPGFMKRRMAAVPHQLIEAIHLHRRQGSPRRKLADGEIPAGGERDDTASTTRRDPVPLAKSPSTLW